MADRRMFAKTIVLSDAFLDMPLSSRCLYFTFGMLADDDGFINSPKSIMRQCGALEDDLKLLITKKFVIPFDSGVIVIKHWRINNYLRRDRYTETKYTDEKAQLDTRENGAYFLPNLSGIPSNGIPNIGTPSKGKDRIDKDIELLEINSNSLSVRKTDYDIIIDLWNQLDGLGNIKSIRSIGEGSKRRDNARARLKQYGIDGFRDAIEKIKESDFLQGKHKGRPWVITFDWFILPSNFPKVLEGNYDNSQRDAPNEANREFNIDEWSYGE